MEASRHPHLATWPISSPFHPRMCLLGLVAEAKKTNTEILFAEQINSEVSVKIDKNRFERVAPG
jgi:hypothetical protein